MGMMNETGFNGTGMSGPFTGRMMMDGVFEGMMMDSNMGSFSKYGNMYHKFEALSFFNHFYQPNGMLNFFFLNNHS